LIYTYHAGTGNSKFHNQEGEDAAGLDGSRPCKHLAANLSACWQWIAREVCFKLRLRGNEIIGYYCQTRQVLPVLLTPNTIVHSNRIQGSTTAKADIHEVRV
jgi:hypothetical protein